jgi:hypothetical protein
VCVCLLAPADTTGSIRARHALHIPQHRHPHTKLVQLHGCHGQPYPNTPFNAFRQAVNKLRSGVLGATAANQTVEMIPYLAYKSYSSSRTNSSFDYQELILHAGVAGVDRCVAPRFTVRCVREQVCCPRLDRAMCASHVTRTVLEACTHSLTDVEQLMLIQLARHLTSHIGFLTVGDSLVGTVHAACITCRFLMWNTHAVGDDNSAVSRSLDELEAVVGAAQGADGKGSWASPQVLTPTALLCPWVPPHHVASC